MLLKSFFILLAVGLLALEPALPPAPLAGVQKQDSGLACPIKGLCGISFASSVSKPSLCGQTLPGGLYPAGCVPSSKGFYTASAPAKWFQENLNWAPPQAPTFFALSTSKPCLFSTVPEFPPPRV